jgi:hypothetical protein
VSSPQPPYGAPHPGYGAPPGYPLYQKPVPKRRRPSGWWFVAASLLIVVGLAIGVLLIAQIFLGFFSVDATIQGDGQTHEVTVKTDRDRMVWVDQNDDRPACTIVDKATGEEVRLEGIGNAAYTKSSGRRDWQGDATFDPGSGVLEVTCAQDGGPIQIGPAPEFGAPVGGLAAGILIPLLFGGAGFVMLIVVTVLYATGRPRDVPAPQ